MERHGLMSFCSQGLKKFRPELRPGPMGKEVKFQGVSALPTRNP
jgi:hypothetical protein